VVHYALSPLFFRQPSDDKSPTLFFPRRGKDEIPDSSLSSVWEGRSGRCKREEVVIADNQRQSIIGLVERVGERFCLHPSTDATAENGGKIASTRWRRACVR
jgi:hypothetical protein